MKLDKKEEDGFASVSEAMLYLGLSRPTVYDMMKRGDLPSVQIGRLHRIPKSALTEYMERALAR
jgi:excisionase family DNA binding protein